MVSFREQFVQQHAQGVDIRPVSMSKRSSGPVPGSCKQGCRYLRITREEGLFCQTLIVALAMPKSMTFGTGVIMHRDHDVRGLRSGE